MSRQRERSLDLIRVENHISNLEKTIIATHEWKIILGKEEREQNSSNSRAQKANRIETMNQSSNTKKTLFHP